MWCVWGMKPKALLVALLAALLVCNHTAFSKPLSDPPIVSFPTDLRGTWKVSLQRAGKSKPETSTAILRQEEGILQVVVQTPVAKEPRITSVTLFQKGKGTYALGNPDFQRADARYALIQKNAQGHSIRLVEGDGFEKNWLAVANMHLTQLAKKTKPLLELIKAGHFVQAAPAFWELKNQEGLEILLYLANCISWQDLEQGMQSKEGRLFYDQVFYAFYLQQKGIFGATNPEITLHMKRIIEAKERAVVSLQDYVKRKERGELKIFPITLHHVMNHTRMPTQLEVEWKWDGTLGVVYKRWLQHPDVLNKDPEAKWQPLPIVPEILCEDATYAEDVKTLSPKICERKGEKEAGVVISGDELIGIHYYDKNTIQYTLPLELLMAEEMQNASHTKMQVDVLMLISTPLMLAMGGGGVVAEGVVSGLEAGAAVATQGGIRALAARLAPGLVTLGYRIDQGVVAFGSAYILIDDYREKIEERFGEKGKKFLRAMDYLQSAMAVYGMVRVVQQTGIARAFRSAYTDVRTEYHLYRAQKALTKADKKLEKIFAEIETFEQKLLAAEPEIVPQAKGNKLTPVEEKALKDALTPKSLPAAEKPNKLPAPPPFVWPEMPPSGTTPLAKWTDMSKGALSAEEFAKRTNGMRAGGAEVPPSKTGPVPAPEGKLPAIPPLLPPSAMLAKLGPSLLQMEAKLATIGKAPLIQTVKEMARLEDAGRIVGMEMWTKEMVNREAHQIVDGIGELMGAKNVFSSIAKDPTKRLYMSAGTKDFRIEQLHPGNTPTILGEFEVYNTAMEPTTDPTNLFKGINHCAGKLGYSPSIPRGAILRIQWPPKGPFPISGGERLYQLDGSFVFRNPLTKEVYNRGDFVEKLIKSFVTNQDNLPNLNQLSSIWIMDEAGNIVWYVEKVKDASTGATTWIKKTPTLP